MIQIIELDKHTALEESPTQQMADFRIQLLDNLQDLSQLKEKINSYKGMLSEVDLVFIQTITYNKGP